MTMASPKAVLKSVCPKLVPFFKTVAVYFVVFIPEGNPSWLACLLKCLPIMSLVVFVLLNGMGRGEEYRYSRRILAGLMLSCLGDALLIDMKNNLIAGILCFMAAHLCYTSAFGFQPLSPLPGGVCLGASVGFYCMLTPGLQGVMLPATLCYLLVITVMVWRAIARVQLFEDLWTWTKLCSCAGGLMFLVSDTALSFNTFRAPVPYGQAIIMVTYYLAQLGMALSVVDSMSAGPAKSHAHAGRKRVIKVN